MANERARGLGYKFVTDDKYLVNPFSPTEGISYEGDGSPVSYANSGIMSGYMTPPKIIYPPINESGGDGPVDPGPPDYGYTGPGSTGSVGGFNIEDIGEGTIDDEDDEKGSLGIVDALRAMGAFTLGGPLNAGYSLKRSVDRNKQKEIDKINAAIEAQYGPNDPGLRGRDDTPGFGKTSTGNYTNQFDGGDPGQGQGSNDHDGGASADAQSDDAAGAGGYARGGRAGYFFGGRVNYKKGGRGRTDAESQYGADSVGSYDSSQNKSGRQQSYGGNDTKQPALLVKKVNTIDTSGLKSKSPEINIDYTDPRNYASLKGSIYNTNILDNDDINVDGTLSGEFGPVSYNTNFTDQGITGTNLTAGNFSADIDANKNYSLGYTNNYNGIDYGAKYDNDGNLMFNAGVTFKNGGLAGLL